MKRHHHSTNNDVLAAPSGGSIERCSALPITRVLYSDDQEGVVSFWMPSAEELQRLNAGKPVALSILGATHPPLYVGVDGGPELPTSEIWMSTDEPKMGDQG